MTRTGMMHGYLRRIQGFGPDIKLFLLYNLLANIGYGVIELIFNLYLLKLGLLEDFIGEWRAVQTICMAVSAALIGTILNRFGIWRGIVSRILSPDPLVAGTGIRRNTASAPHSRWMLRCVTCISLQPLDAIHSRMVSIRPTSARRRHLFLCCVALLNDRVTCRWVRTVPDQCHRPHHQRSFRSVLPVGAGRGTIIASLGLVPMFMMGEARRARPRREVHATTVPETTAQRRQVRNDMSISFLRAGS